MVIEIFLCHNFYGVPTGMLKLILSATAPHSALEGKILVLSLFVTVTDLFMVKTDIQAMMPTSHTRAPNPLAITSFLMVA